MVVVAVVMMVILYGYCFVMMECENKLEEIRDRKEDHLMRNTCRYTGVM